MVVFMEMEITLQADEDLFSKLKKFGKQGFDNFSFPQ